MKSIHEPSKVKNLFFKILWLSCLDLTLIQPTWTLIPQETSRGVAGVGGQGMDKKGRNGNCEVMDAN